MVGPVTVPERAEEVLDLDMDPLLHDAHVGEIGEVEVEVDLCQDRYKASFAALALDLAPVVGEGWDLEVAPVDHMGLVVEMGG